MAGTSPREVGRSSWRARWVRLAPRRPSLPGVIDATLVALLLSACFLLACCNLYDADMWWHLAGGRWILEQGHFPGKDPFTFGSADRVWIDLNWLFQIPLALLYGWGNLAAVILWVAAMGTAALALTAWRRDRGWPWEVIVLSWIPAVILMSSRIRPRPEVLTLLYLAVFLAVLLRASRRPALLWLLPLVQILWVNTHGLFVLGPALVGAYVLDQGWLWLVRRRRPEAVACAESPLWKHLVPTAGLVIVACLANPYFLDGALFPFMLLPKVAAGGNFYKQTIDEFLSPRAVAMGHPNTLGAEDVFSRALVFLLLMLPCSFVLPAVWEFWRGAPKVGRKRGMDADRNGGPSGSWLGALGAATALAAILTAALPGRMVSGWLVGADSLIPAGFVLLAGIGAWSLMRRSRSAAGVVLLGSIFQAAWASWLFAYLVQAQLPAVPLSLVVAAATGLLLAVLLAWRRPGALFRLLLVAAFGYLALNAVRNVSLFGVVGGAILAWNLGEWIVQLSMPRSVTWSLRAAAAVLLGIWLIALASNHYYPWTGLNIGLGLGETPFAFAHDAARFAGQKGLPSQAFVSDFRQAGVYIFHNGPTYKPFIDPRLELPRMETFQQDLQMESWLHEQDPRGLQALQEMGNPLVLCFHTYHKNSDSEAFLLKAGWHCIYFDAVAAVFVHGELQSPLPYPDVDFAARLFRPASCPLIPDQPGAAVREAHALWAMGKALRLSDDDEWKRTAVLLGALGRAKLGLEQDPTSARAWSLLGDTQQKLLADPAPVAPGNGWDPSRILPWAHATYCYHQAMRRDPNDETFLNLLFQSYHARAMADALLQVGEKLVQQNVATADQQIKIDKLRYFLNQLNQQPSPPGETPGDAILRLLKTQRPQMAVQLAGEAEKQGVQAWPWPVADPLAIAYLHLGRPGDARHIWEKSSPPNPAARLCRLASTFWVERDLPEAIRLYQKAQAADPNLVEPWWGLAMIFTQLNQPDAALEACGKGVKLHSTRSQRAALQQLLQLLPRYAGHKPAGTGESVR